MFDLAPRGPGGLYVQGLHRSFNGREVLGGLSLDLAAGAALGVVGENGTGKTTLLRCLAGTLAPDAGTIEIVGAPPGSGSAYLVPAADRMLNWRLTGRQNLSFLGRLARFHGDELQARVESAAAETGARPLLDVRAGELSTGQRRRLMLASALVSGAPVLLLDEPLADLDADGADQVGACIDRWASAGGTVLSVAPIETQLPAGRAAALADGRLTWT